jgi:hypothetical protein
MGKKNLHLYELPGSATLPFSQSNTPFNVGHRKPALDSPDSSDTTLSRHGAVSRALDRLLLLLGYPRRIRRSQKLTRFGYYLSVSAAVGSSSGTTGLLAQMVFMDGCALERPQCWPNGCLHSTCQTMNAVFLAWKGSKVGRNLRQGRVVGAEFLASVYGHPSHSFDRLSLSYAKGTPKMELDRRAHWPPGYRRPRLVRTGDGPGLRYTVPWIRSQGMQLPRTGWLGT